MSPFLWVRSPEAVSQGSARGDLAPELPLVGMGGLRSRLCVLSSVSSWPHAPSIESSSQQACEQAGNQSCSNLFPHFCRTVLSAVMYWSSPHWKAGREHWKCWAHQERFRGCPPQLSCKCWQFWYLLNTKYFYTCKVFIKHAKFEIWSQHFEVPCAPFPDAISSPIPLEITTT